MIVVVAFVVLLLIGVPISLVVLIASAAGVVAYSNVPALIVVQQMFNGLNNFVLLAIPFFIMAGNVAAKGNIAKNLINVMRLAFGRIKGGSIIASIVACTFFAAISGSSMATVVAIGTIMIPALIDMGYSEELAEGAITSAGSIGMLIPPSAPMIMICVAMGTSVGKQFMAGFLPGILLAIVWSVYVYFKCKKGNIQDTKTYTKEEKKEIWKQSVLALIYPLIVLGGIYLGFATPTEAAAIALIYVILVELLVYRTMSVKDIVNECFSALVTSGAIIFIISCAAVLNWFITTQQIPTLISTWITTYVSSKVAFILILTALFFICGCFMDLIAMIVILGPILAPTLGFYGIDPIHFGIIAVMNSQISYLSPPFGLNLYVTMGMRKKSIGQIVKGVLPFLLILVAVTLVISFVPQITMLLTNMMK